MLGFVSTLALVKLLLIAFAVGGILYVCVGSNVFSKANENWWASLPSHKKVVFGCAIGATVIQTFL